MGQDDIIVVTTDTIPGKKIVKTLGLVEARNNPLGGPLLAQSSAQKNLKKQAQKLGANAIVGLQTQRQARGRQVTYYLSGTAIVVED